VPEAVFTGNPVRPSMAENAASVVTSPAIRARAHRSASQGVQTLGVAVSHVQRSSTVQSAAQPSPGAVLPSSQSSPAATTPSPQVPLLMLLILFKTLLILLILLILLWLDFLDPSSHEAMTRMGIRIRKTNIFFGITYTSRKLRLL